MRSILHWVEGCLSLLFVYHLQAYKVVTLFTAEWGRKEATSCWFRLFCGSKHKCTLLQCGFYRPPQTGGAEPHPALQTWVMHVGIFLQASALGQSEGVWIFHMANRFRSQWDKSFLKIGLSHATWAWTLAKFLFSLHLVSMMDFT